MNVTGNRDENPNGTVCLNVMGKRMETTLDTLRKSRGILGRMFDAANESMLRKSPDGTVFFDCDPDYFRHMLNCIRYDSWSMHSLPPILSGVIWTRFLDYWGVDISDNIHSREEKQGIPMAEAHETRSVNLNKRKFVEYGSRRDQDKKFEVDGDTGDIVFTITSDKIRQYTTPGTTSATKTNELMMRTLVYDYFFDCDEYKQNTVFYSSKEFVVDLLPGTMVSFLFDEQCQDSLGVVPLVRIDIVKWLNKKLGSIDQRKTIFKDSEFGQVDGKITWVRGERTKKKERTRNLRWPASEVYPIVNIDEHCFVSISFFFVQ